MAGKTVGELQIDLQMKGDSLNASMKNVEKTVKKDGTKSGGVFGNALAVAAGNIISSGLSTVTSGIMGQLDNAIKRVDTINAYPKLMKNFGVANDEAKASIERISEGIKGLPTSLDSAVSGVQNLFMVTKDLKSAEDIFSSVNNAAMIFANGSTEATDRFIYAFKQAMSAGKVSAQDFNQMNEAIPGVLDKVAEVMGITFGELKEGLSNGAISMDDFNKALNKLNKEGVGETQALEQGVKDATGGIQTVIENVQTAIQRGWAAIIEAIGQGTIETTLENLGKVIEGVMVVVGSAITFLINNQWLWPILAGVFGILVGLIIAATTATLGLNAAMFANPIVWIVAGIAALIAIIILLITHFDTVKEVAMNICSAIGGFFAGLWEGIVNIFSGVVGFFKGVFQGAWNAVKAVFSGVKNFFKGIFDGIVGIFKTVGSTIGDAVSGAFKAVVNGIIGFAEGFVNTPIHAINALIDVINAIPGISLGKLTPLKLPRLAQGGLVTGSTIANIGENGREAVLPLDRNTDNWSGLLASALADEFESRERGGGGFNVENMNFNINNDMDAADIDRKIINRLRRAV